ncbi:hypothetical protein K7X08_038129 [Anisodus acutangulus]|uniref:Uncharacterized protein n=1 Tax=Anisodus acutangulus TaxID=402998 RepID=A0A9Q1N1M6_9SOLA|nr:hypothetical protein K7X08_038129 [Anisodus acutangulus]
MGRMRNLEKGRLPFPGMLTKILLHASVLTNVGGYVILHQSNKRYDVTNAARGEIDLEELQQQIPHTVQFLGLAPPPSLPPDEDVNSVTKDDTYYGVDCMP